MPNHDPEYYPQKKENAQDRDLAPILGDLSQSEKLSEIKSPLTIDYLDYVKFVQNLFTKCYFILFLGYQV